MKNFKPATIEAVKELTSNSVFHAEYYNHVEQLNTFNANLTEKFTLELWYGKLIYKYVLRRNGKTYTLDGSKGKLYLFEDKPFNASSRHNDLSNEASVKAKVGKQPNYMGVLTDKKVNEWLDYCDRLNDALESEWQKQNEVVQAFYASIAQYPINYSNDRKKGWYILNGLKFTFCISNMQISQNIEVNLSGPNNFQSFLKLSDNGFKTIN